MGGFDRFLANANSTRAPYYPNDMIQTSEWDAEKVGRALKLYTYLEVADVDVVLNANVIATRLGETVDNVTKEIQRIRGKDETLKINLGTKDTHIIPLKNNRLAPFNQNKYDLKQSKIPKPVAKISTPEPRVKSSRPTLLDQSSDRDGDNDVLKHINASPAKDKSVGTEKRKRNPPAGLPGLIEDTSDNSVADTSHSKKTKIAKLATHPISQSLLDANDPKARDTTVATRTAGETGTGGAGDNVVVKGAKKDGGDTEVDKETTMDTEMRDDTLPTDESMVDKQ